MQIPQFQPLLSMFLLARIAHPAAARVALGVPLLFI